MWFCLFFLFLKSTHFVKKKFKLNSCFLWPACLNAMYCHEFYFTKYDNLHFRISWSGWNKLKLVLRIIICKLFNGGHSHKWALINMQKQTNFSTVSLWSKTIQNYNTPSLFFLSKRIILSLKYEPVYSSILDQNFLFCFLNHEQKSILKLECCKDIPIIIYSIV